MARAGFFLTPQEKHKSWCYAPTPTIPMYAIVGRHTKIDINPERLRGAETLLNGQFINKKMMRRISETEERMIWSRDLCLRICTVRAQIQPALE